MNLIIVPTPNFQKSVKKLLKKYKSLLKDLEMFFEDYELLQKQAQELGSNCFKIRLANSSIPIGKSGGFRVIYFIKQENKIYLLEIYSKSQQANISKEQITEILEKSGLC
jgi:hypothetical protein